jgi:hypothetical protein
VDQLLQETSRFGSKPIVSVWIGGNDIGAFTSGLSPDTSVAAYASALSRIVGTGVSDLLLFEIPDVGFTPLLQDFTPGADTAAASGATANLGRTLHLVGAGSGRVHADNVLGSVPSDRIAA